MQNIGDKTNKPSRDENKSNILFKLNTKKFFNRHV